MEKEAIEKIPVGVSMCLLGEPVRYNGQHCREKLLLGPLSEYLDYKPYCPEVGIGLGVPRATLRLVEKEGAPHICNSTDDDLDYTDQMQDWIDERLQDIEKQELCGFVFKKGSPSCGAFRVKLFNEKGHMQHNKESGLFAAAVQKKFPWMPVEEEGRLNDAGLFDNFFMRVIAIGRWKKMMKSELTISKLTDFQRDHKYWLMAHSPQGQVELGRHLAENAKGNLQDVAEYYFERFCEMTLKPATRGKHANVLQHILGYFRDCLDDFDRGEIHELIQQYNNELVPLVVPASRLSYCVKKYDKKYLAGQNYLNYPVDLAPLNKL